MNTNTSSTLIDERHDYGVEMRFDNPDNQIGGRRKRLQ
jgi:hypothetical protein